MAVTETTESRWFKIVVFLASGFFLGFSIANAVYYDRIRRGASCDAITKGEADTMFWINVILAFIAGIVFLWSIYKLFTKDYRESKKNQVLGYLQAAPAGGGFFGGTGTQAVAGRA